MTDALIIHTTELCKTYDGVDAVRGLNLRVPAGSICGFLGRNGAGKTTTIKLLLGMARPTSGEARVFGLRADQQHSSVEIRRRTGFVSDDKDLYGYMSVAEMIRFTRAFFPQWRRDLEERYLRVFELPRDRKVKSLSRGTRTKLALLLALCRGAELLVLDEPTSGLDPAAIEEVLQALVKHVSTERMTVFFSSHQIAEVEQISDRIVIIERGRAVVEGELDELRARYCRVQAVFDGPAPEYTFRAPGVTRTSRRGRVLSALATGGSEQVVLEARTLNAVAVDVMPVTLKEIFLETVVEEN